MRTAAAEKPLQLDYYADEGSQVIVTPQDEDRFLLSVQEAAEACRAGNKAILFKRQFGRLLKRLALWLGQYEEGVSRAFVTIRDAGLLFLVVQKTKAYDRDFENALTSLDIEIARDSNLDMVNLSVLALPSTSEDSYQSFAAPTFTLVYKQTSAK